VDRQVNWVGGWVKYERYNRWDAMELDKTLKRERCVCHCLGSFKSHRQTYLFMVVVEQIPKSRYLMKILASISAFHANKSTEISFSCH